MLYRRQGSVHPEQGLPTQIPSAGRRRVTVRRVRRRAQLRRIRFFKFLNPPFLARRFACLQKVVVVVRTHENGPRFEVLHALGASCPLCGGLRLNQSIRLKTRRLYTNGHNVVFFRTRQNLHGIHGLSSMHSRQRSPSLVEDARLQRAQAQGVVFQRVSATQGVSSLHTRCQIPRKARSAARF